MPPTTEPPIATEATTAEPTAASTEPKAPQERLSYRRDLVESYMRQMMCVRWKVPNAISYSAVHNSKGLDADDPSQVIQIIPNQVYQGIPYTHGGGSCYSFLALAGEPDENGVYTLQGLTRDLLSGYSGSDLYNTSRLGNDCADAVFWAWAQVSSTIKFPFTNYMIPSYGCLRVGDYDCADTNYSGNTNEICKQNGLQRMFEAYACLQKGDALVRTINSAGHAIMAVSAQVQRLEDGTIDGNNSYLIYLDQDIYCERNTVRYEDPVLGSVLLCEELDKKQTFSKLFETGYLPVTCQELVDPAPLKDTSVTDSLSTISSDNLFSGKIEASYRIAYVQVQIADAQDNVVQEAICFGLQEDMYLFDLSRFTSETEQRVLIGSIDLDTLPAGSYRYRFTCKLSNGDEVVFREGIIEK